MQFRFSRRGRFALEAMGWTVVAALVIGIPTVMIDTPFFRRMTAVFWWQYVFWAASALLTGAALAARRLAPADCRVEGRAASGSGLAFLAVGCPICNKLVVAALGTSGALSFFAPVQPLIGAVALVILGLTIRRTMSRRGSFDAATT